MTRTPYPEPRIPELVLALDVPTRQQALSWARLLYPRIKIFKVGLQLYTACGPQIVADLRAMGAEVFLDLKLNDIPQTMAKAAEEIIKLKAAFFTVHALSGPEALKAVAGACQGAKTRPLAVTILTSIGAHFLRDLSLRRGLPEAVLYLAKLAERSGICGVVCSAQEAGMIRRGLGKDFLIVTPGIRPQAAASHDQKRVCSARAAAKAGSDFLVVGRPILAAQNPLLAARALLAEIRQ
jgi:orotidine-5'-phosphate decarboxylase